MSAHDKLNFEVRLADYPLQAVHAACYTFLDRAYVSLDMTPAGDLAVTMKPKTGASAEAFAAIEGKFPEELLHRALRLKLSDNSRKISEYIVAKALSDAPAPFEMEAVKNDSLIDEKLEKDIQAILAEVEAASAGKDAPAPWDANSKPFSEQSPVGEQPPAAEDEAKIAPKKTVRKKGK